MSDYVLLYWGYTPGDTETARIGMESGEKLRQMFSAGGQKYKFCEQKIQIDIWDMPHETSAGVNVLILHAAPLSNANISSASLCMKQLRQAAIADGWTDDSNLVNHPRTVESRNSKIRFANTAAQREYDEEHTPLVVHVAPESRVPTKSGGSRRCKTRRHLRRKRNNTRRRR